MKRGQAVAFGTDGRDRREPAGACRPSAGGRVPGADHARGRSARSDPASSPIWPGAPRTIASRRQVRQLRSPRYLAALRARARATCGSWRWSSGPHRPPPVLVGARWLELLGAIGVVGALLWGWVFGVERRVLAFSPGRGDVPLLGTGDATRARAVQAAAKPGRSSCSTRCSGRLSSRASGSARRRGSGRSRSGSCSRRSPSTGWAPRSCAPACSSTGASPCATGSCRSRCCGVRAGRAGVERPGCVAGPRRRLGGRTRPPFSMPWPTRRQTGRPGVLLAPFRAMVRPLAAHTLGDWLRAVGPALGAAGASLRLGHPGGHRVRGSGRRSVPAARAGARPPAGRRCRRLAHRKPPAAAAPRAHRLAGGRDTLEEPARGRAHPARAEHRDGHPRRGGPGGVVVVPGRRVRRRGGRAGSPRRGPGSRS